MCLQLLTHTTVRAVGKRAKRKKRKENDLIAHKMNWKVPYSLCFSVKQTRGSGICERSSEKFPSTRENTCSSDVFVPNCKFRKNKNPRMIKLH